MLTQLCLVVFHNKLSNSKSISKQEMIETYFSIGEIQKDDVDFFIIETMSSIDEAVSAVEALSNFNKEIILNERQNIKNIAKYFTSLL